MTGYQDLNGDRQRLYSCHVTKINRHRSADTRIFVLCDKYMYLLHKNYKSSKKSPIEIEKVIGLSISPGNDNALIVHCEVRKKLHTV